MCPVFFRQSNKKLVFYLRFFFLLFSKTIGKLHFCTYKVWQSKKYKHTVVCFFLKLAKWITVVVVVIVVQTKTNCWLKYNKKVENYIYKWCSTMYDKKCAVFFFLQHIALLFCSTLCFDWSFEVCQWIFPKAGINIYKCKYLPFTNRMHWIISLYFCSCLLFCCWKK